MEFEKSFKNSILKETGPRYGQKFVCSENPGQNIWHKVKKFSKSGQNFKDLLFNFVGFFDSYCQSLIFGRKTGHYAASLPKFDIFLISEVLSRSATRKATGVLGLLC